LNHHIPALLVFTAVLSSCNSEPGTDPQGGITPPPGTSSSFTGRLYFDSCFSDGFAFLDMASEKETFVLSDDSMRRISISPSSIKIAAQDTNKKIYILDSQNTADSYTLTNSQNFSGILRFSSDSKYFLINEDNSVGTDYLRVREGSTKVSELIDDDFPGYTFQSYDWIDDDSYVFASAGNIYRVDGIVSPTVTLLISETDYTIGHLSVSPNKDKMAYTKGVGQKPWNEEGDIYIAKIDGSEEQALTVNSSLRNSEWSPNGLHLAVAAGSYHGGYDQNAGFFPEVYVIDVSAPQPLTVNYGQAFDLTYVTRLNSIIDGSGTKKTCTDGNELFWNK